MRKSIFILLPFISIFVSCKKYAQDGPIDKHATVAIVYAVAAEFPYSAYRVNFTERNTSFSSLESFNYYSYDGNNSNSITKFIGVKSQIDVDLRSWTEADSVKYIFNRKMRFNNNDNYTLLLYGSADSIRSKFLQDDLQPITEPAMGIRFMNLSPDVDAVSINVLGKKIGSEVVRLKYEGISDFVLYKSQDIPIDCTFEFRDAATGEFLASYSFDPSFAYLPLRNYVSLVLRGRKFTTPSLEVVRANNY